MAYRKWQEFQLINKYHLQSLLDLYYTKQKTKNQKQKQKTMTLKTYVNFTQEKTIRFCWAEKMNQD